MADIKRTASTKNVLRELLSARAGDGEVYVNQVAVKTNMGPSTVHYILNRLLDAGWVTARREDPSVRTARRFFTLTENGAREAVDLLET